MNLDRHKPEIGKKAVTQSKRDRTDECKAEDRCKVCGKTKSDCDC